DWHGGFWTSRSFEATSTGALRGGPAILRPGAWRGNVWMGTDSRKPVRLNAWTSFGKEDEGAGWYRNGGVDVTWRPSGRLDLSLGPNINERYSRWQ
ncbi:MAG: hypothetical protein GWM90_00090, partial [Gemmatimonadetes bacterium]|nr:hypothetical protein [Gemmatimonadota bacterium]NIQ51920.1 hypothetical protein [Gemmatimonadota bacterium]NIU72027.1 hypothetical protein [Gammaproteobacteria bacterium]NIX42589.1 hypothetical protein [Gemmatimonadota bacterium]NIY06764.1 hypothetical protein [Gemmatimonadota bacterium]